MNRFEFAATHSLQANADTAKLSVSKISRLLEWEK